MEGAGANANERQRQRQQRREPVSGDDPDAGHNRGVDLLFLDNQSTPSVVPESKAISYCTIDTAFSTDRMYRMYFLCYRYRGIAVQSTTY